MNLVWNLVLKPNYRQVIETKWGFSQKLDENDIVTRNKVRLVARGYNLEEGIDYEETYASVARLEAIWTLLAFACILDFILYQMDAKNAFLNSFIKGELYVSRLMGFEKFNFLNYA